MVIFTFYTDVTSPPRDWSFSGSVHMAGVVLLAGSECWVGVRLAAGYLSLCVHCSPPAQPLHTASATLSRASTTTPHYSRPTAAGSPATNHSHQLPSLPQLGLSFGLVRCGKLCFGWIGFRLGKVSHLKVLQLFNLPHCARES